MFDQFACNDERTATEAGEIVTIGVPDPTNESVQTKAFESASDLTGRFPAQVGAQAQATETIERELAAQQGEQVLRSSGGMKLKPPQLRSRGSGAGPDG